MEKETELHLLLKRTIREVMIGWMFLFALLYPVSVVQASDNKADDKSMQKDYIPEKPIIKTAEATSGAAVSLSWKKVRRASRYTVYRSSKKNGTYKKLRTTSKCTFSDKTGKQLHTYYYKVSASCKNNSDKWSEGRCSRAVAVKVRRIARKIAYAGDSIMSGYSIYGLIPNSKKQKVIAQTGVSTSNFYNGQCMKRLLDYNPDRLYIMLGVNALPGRTNSTYMDYIIKYYGYILGKCLKKNPDMEIIVMGVSPVGRGANVRLGSVKLFNKKLKTLLKNKKFRDVHYMDLFPVLADSSGYLKGQYGAGDNIHWNRGTYSLVLQEMKKAVRKF